MGEEGFSSDSSLLYHRGVPSAIVDSQVWELPDLDRHRRTTRSSRGTSGCTACSAAGRGPRRRSHGPAAGARQRRRPDLLRRRRRGLAVLPQRRRRRVRVRRAGQRHRRDGVRRAALPDRRLRDRAAGDDAPLAARRAEHGSTPIEANSHIAPPKRYLSRFGQLLEHAPYCERDLHGPDEPFLVEGTDVEVLVKHRGNGPSGLVGTPDDLRDASVRRGRLGRLPLPVHVQRRGLHADHRQGPPAAAGAPGLRGPQLRDLQLRARARSTTTRSRSRCPTTTRTWTPTR